ncbi:MAG TPA: hypothetical protein VFS29_03090 [Motilibacteraceae bacterium]|nr:hypothetical protein [Motilibacteraceae bacterium]
METSNQTHQPKGVGATGGLPGANADPAAARIADDELAVVASGEVAAPGEDLPDAHHEGETDLDAAETPPGLTS